MHVCPPQKKSLRIKNNIPISELRDIQNVEFYLGGCPTMLFPLIPSLNSKNSPPVSEGGDSEILTKCLRKFSEFASI